MRHFVIYTNLHKDKDLTVTDRVRQYLQNKGMQVHTWEELHGKSIDADCMLVLGGDGTMLQAARDMGEHPIPLIGVNLGTLGYTTEIEQSALEESLDKLIADEYTLENRMMLDGAVLRKEPSPHDFEDAAAFVAENWALNDIVISRSGSLHIIRFKIYVNGRFLSEYSADGVIVTTPTGSTGYNLSAGGPIVQPCARLMIITPICAHTLNQRSVILDSRDVIEIEIADGREGREQAVEASFDGNMVVHLQAGDRVRITQSKRTTDIVKLSQASFLEILREKLSAK